MPESWWRSFELELEQTALGELDVFQLGLRRRAQEFWVWHATAEEERGPEWAFDGPSEPPAVDTLYRHLFRRTPSEVSIRPALADRPVVAQPVVRCSIPPGEEATIYVGTPIWVEVAVGEPKVRLLSTPLDRPADVWLGPSTWEGELCYFASTRARLSLENVEMKETRALTEVVVRNHSPDPLELSRISLPVPFLSLFRGTNGGLWTERTSLEHRESGAMAKLEIGEADADDHGELLAGPRRSGGPGTFVRAFGALFGPRQEGRR